jgi:two-component system, LytTR family, response regulator
LYTDCQTIMNRILIIDDEEAVRSLLRRILSIRITAEGMIDEAGSISSALEKIQEFKPDIVLLDIRLSDGTGFDLLKRLENISFKVIFVTAFEKYAIQAFKYSAVDYILKPIDPDELLQAIAKAGEIIQHEEVQRLNTLWENLAPENPHKKILVRTSDNIYLVKTDELLCCESDRSYTRLHLLDGKVILVSRSLKEFEEMLSPIGFFRTHKSYLINIQLIDHLEKAGGGFVVMKSGMKLPLASRKRDQFMQMLEKTV